MAKMNSLSKRIYLLLVTFITGASVMMLEILGTRVLAPFFGMTIYVWASLISITLTFLAVGYWVGGLIADRKARFGVFYLLPLLSGISLVLVSLIYSPVVRASSSLGLRMGALVSALALFGVPMTLMGMVIPFAVKLGTTELASLGLGAGRVYAVSTLGSVVGTLLISFVLIPKLPIRIILLTMAISLFLLSGVASVAYRKRIGLLLSISSLLAVGAFFCWRGPSEFRDLKLPYSTQAAAYAMLKISREFGDLKLIHSTQSAYGRIDVIDSQGQRYLVTDGIVQTGMPQTGQIEPGFSLFRLNYTIELLPFYSPSGSDALVIGLGGGLIPKMLSAYGKSVDAVEIDPEVVKVARDFFSYQGPVIVADGRSYIQNTNKKYDMIVLDAYASDRLPIHLFTKEMFGSVAGALRKDGVFAINYIGMPEDDCFVTSCLYRTLKSVFKEVKFFRTEPHNQVQVMAVFASNSPLELDRAYLSWILPSANDPFFEHLERLSVSLDGSKGIVVTDEYNPLELAWAQIASEWRQKSEEFLGKDLLTRF